VATWNDVWISESLAEMLPWYFFGETDPAFLEAAVARATESVLGKDLLPGTKPYGNAEECLNYVRCYLKAALIERMVRNYLGAPNFDAALAAYFGEFYLQSSGVSDLIGVYSRFRDCAFMEAWVRQPGYPVVILEEDGTLHQAPASTSAESDGLNWVIPLDIGYGVGRDVRTAQLALGSEPVRVEEGAEWVCLNVTRESLCRVWHKGRFHEGLAAAAGECKLEKATVERVRNDLTWLVSIGVAPQQMLSDFGGKPAKSPAGSPPPGRLGRFAVSD
jgi:aminopeptidase N